MRYEDYKQQCRDDRDRDILKTYERTGSKKETGSALGMSETAVRRALNRIAEAEPAPEAEPSHHRHLPQTRRYVVTCAQNATNPHPGFLASLRQYCDHNDAELVVVPMRYRNPTARMETAWGEKTEYWWHWTLAPYLCGERTELFPGVMLMGDIKIQPTAVNPLSGLQTITGSKCGIFGHTKLAMDSVPTQGTQLPKLLYTTGAVTKQNYSDSKAGKKGEFHHVLGALVVEQDEQGLFHIRNLNANSKGHFTDLGKRYGPDGVEDANPPAAFVMGDLHAIRADEDNVKACHDILDTLKPRRLVLHDALDFQSGSYHNTWFERFLLRQQGKSDVAQELEVTCRMIDELASKADTSIISSNHDEHLLKWLENHHNALDLENAIVYHELKLEMLRSIRDTGDIPDPLEVASRGRIRNRLTFIKDGGLQVHGIEMGYHGDKGPNGAKGSVGAFDRIGVKTITGHSHGPAIVGGAYRAGTSSILDMGYNRGPSNWLHSHVLVNADGKRTHIHVIDGRWKA